MIEQVVSTSSLGGKYAEAVDRESAYEMLQARLEAATTAAQQQEAAEAASKAGTGGRRPAKEEAGERPAKEESGVVGQVLQSTAFRSMPRSAGTVIGREISRSILGTRRR